MTTPHNSTRRPMSLDEYLTSPCSCCGQPLGDPVPPGGCVPPGDAAPSAENPLVAPRDLLELRVGDLVVHRFDLDDDGAIPPRARRGEVVMVEPGGGERVRVRWSNHGHGPYVHTAARLVLVEAARG